MAHICQGSPPQLGLNIDRYIKEEIFTVFFYLEWAIKEVSSWRQIRRRLKNENLAVNMYLKLPGRETRKRSLECQWPLIKWRDLKEKRISWRKIVRSALFFS